MVRTRPAASPPPENGFRIVRTGSTERIVESLRDQIARGELARGSRLPSERNLSAHFSVSTVTVREAIKVLAAMGLVESRHGNGTYITAEPENVAVGSLVTVAQLEGVTLIEIIETLSVLVSGSAEFIVANSTDDDVDRLRDGCAKILAGSTAVEVLPEVEKFLRALVRAAHRPLLAVMADFVIRVLVAVEAEIFPASEVFWRDWKSRLGDARAEVTEAVAARDLARLRSALASYFSSASGIMSDNRIDSSVTLTDPQLVRAVAGLLEPVGPKVTKRP